MSRSGTATVSERIFGSLPYLMPLFDGIIFGVFLFRQFPVLQLIFQPIFPLIQIYNSAPFTGLIIFLGLYLFVVRNDNISHFIRFNSMQAILLDIILSICRLVAPLLIGSLGIPFIQETLYNTIFIGIMAAVIYSVVQSVMGRYAEIPTISEAVEMQVR